MPRCTSAPRHDFEVVVLEDEDDPTLKATINRCRLCGWWCARNPEARKAAAILGVETVPCHLPTYRPAR